MSIRTRFAPSPTGYLHIGGVRTALFNWLLSKRMGGQFILRIDDTDTERNRTEALQPILDGFRWLGILWDEGPEVNGPYAPYFQSQRNQKYVDAAMNLLETGYAYPDYLTKEETDAERKAAEAAKKAYVHRGPHRDTPTAECVRLFRDKPTSLRFKVPLGRDAVVPDVIRGHCVQKTDLMGDPIILRANGTALYNFATVIDDMDLKITHVVRSAEHLANTYIQVLFFEALGATLPVFAHVPVVNAPNSKKKMSKRDMAKFMTPEVIQKLRACWAIPPDISDEDAKKMENLNPATVRYYEALGYLPAAVINYLGRLGWSLDDKTEIIPLDQMQANFSLDRVVDAAASFDPDKLYWMAGEYMKVLPLAEKVEGCLPFLRRGNLIPEVVDDALKARITKIIEAAGDRIKLFSDAMTYAAPFLKSEIDFDPKAVEKRLKKPGVADLLKSFLPRLEAVSPWDAPTLDKLLHDFTTEKGIKPAEMVHPVRVATTGVEVGIGLFDALSLLGRDVTLARVKSVIGEN
jgi:glutamyl-tRNA synthetase